MLTQVMSNLLRRFNVVLKSNCNSPQADCIEQKYNIPGLKNKTCKNKGTPQWKSYSEIP